MKLIKKILPIFLFVLAVFTITSCKDKNKSTYTYPDPVPLYTSNDAFVTINNLTITKEDVYNRLLNSYGLDTLKLLVDTELLKDYVLDEKQSADFEKYLNQIIYGEDFEELDDDAKQEAFEKFESSLVSMGLHADSSKDDALYYRNYYLLQFKKQAKTLDVVTEETKEYDKKASEDGTDSYYLDAEYAAFFNANFHKTYNVIIATFESEAEAYNAMKEAGINLNDLNKDWMKGTDVLTKTQIKDAFVTISAYAFGTASDVTSFTYDELLNIAASSTKDGTIANKVASLSTEELSSSYTHAPLAYNGRWFLAYLDSASEDYYLDVDNTVSVSSDQILKYSVDGAATEVSQELKTLLYPYLIEDELTSSTSNLANVIERVFYELRQAAGLEIYAEGLEIAYKNGYESIFSTLSITDYEAFKATTNTSSTVVAKTNTLSISLDDMYDALTTRYGTLLTLLFLQQYVVLGSDLNKVIDYATLEIKDQSAYAEYVKTDYTAYKDAFDNGDFEANGFPKTYGWDNFLRDYLGVRSEKDIVVDFNSTLYNDVLELYTKALYMAEAGDVELFIPEAASEWYLRSDKWTRTYSTEIETVNVKEGTTPTLSLAFKASDVANVKKDVDEDGNEVALNVADYYGHFVVTYTNTSDETVAIVTDVATDQAVLEKYDEIFNETFSLTASGFYVYFDANHDGIADVITDDDDDDLGEKEEKETKRNQAKALTDNLWSLAYNAFIEEQIEKTYPRHTVSEYINNAIRVYETSNEHYYVACRQSGLRVSVVNSNTYTRTSNVSTELLDALKAMWVKVYETSTSIMGQSLDPVYRWVENDVVNTLKAMSLGDEAESILSNNAYYHLAITKATARTSYSYSSTSVTQTPNYYLYTEYQKDSADRALTIYCSSQFTSYYTPAISALTTTDILNKALMEDCKALLAKVTFTDDAENSLNKLTTLIDSALSELE